MAKALPLDHPDRPSWEEVFAYMEATGDGYRKTAAHFEDRGITIGMIKGEASRRRKRAAKAAAKGQGTGGQGSPAGSPGAGSTQAPSPSPGERAEPGTPSVDVSAATLSETTLVEVTEALVRAAMLRRIAWLADPDSIGSRNQRDVATTFGILVDKRKALLRQIKGDAPTESKREEENRVLASLGITREEVEAVPELPEGFDDEASGDEASAPASVH